MIIFAALVVLAAQLTTNMAANVVSPSNDFSNLSPRRISYVTGGLITAVIGILMMPWKLYSDAAAYIFTWLIGYSSLMGALGGILIADYWVLRTQRLDSSLICSASRARTPTANGFNWRAIAALVSSIAPGRARLHPRGDDAGRTGCRTRPSSITLYSYAWFVTFALSFVIYLLSDAEQRPRETLQRLYTLAEIHAPYRQMRTDSGHPRLRHRRAARDDPGSATSRST